MSTKTDSSSLLGTWLEGLSPDAVESWVQDRLAGRDARFPIRESEESRGEILLRLAEGRALSDPLITRLAAVIDRATIDQVTRAAPDLREFSETLALYGRFPGTGCVGAIRSVIGTSLWTSVYWTDHDLDIRVVNALACKASRVDREFWMHLAGQPRTGEAAIAALLAANGWEAALDALVSNLHVFRDPPLSARLPLRLTQVYRASSGAQFFQQRLNTLNLAPADRDLLQPTLMRFGVMLAAHAPPPSLALLTRVLALANNLRADQVDRFARASLVRALADSSSLTEARDLEAA